MEKAGLGPREIVKWASLNLARLPCLLGLFVFILADFNRPRAECALMCDTCVLKYLRSEVHKRREILSHTSVFNLTRRI